MGSFWDEVLGDSSALTDKKGIIYYTYSSASNIPIKKSKFPRLLRAIGVDKISLILNEGDDSRPLSVQEVLDDPEVLPDGAKVVIVPVRTDG